MPERRTATTTSLAGLRPARRPTAHGYCVECQPDRRTARGFCGTKACEPGQENHACDYPDFHCGCLPCQVCLALSDAPCGVCGNKGPILRPPSIN